MTTETLENDWVGMQKKTFKNWINNKLRRMGRKEIEDITLDCRDGIVLINLLSDLSGEVIRHNPVITINFQALENNSYLIKYLESRSIEIVNIQASDLVDGNEKLILGLIWRIILRFGITGFGDENVNMRAALLKWCKYVTEGYQNVKINDFSKSWKCGLAFNAIIHKYRPDLVGDFENLTGNSPLKNLERAFLLAEDHLDIPRLLDAEDIHYSVNPDEKSVMTYVAQYYNKFTKLEREADLKRKIQNAVKTINWALKLKHSYESKAEAYLNMLQAFDEEGEKFMILQEAYISALKARIQLASDLNFKLLEIKGLYGDILSISSIFNFTPYEPIDRYKFENVNKGIVKSTPSEQNDLNRIELNLLKESECQMKKYKEVFNAFNYEIPVDVQISRIVDFRNKNYFEEKSYPVSIIDKKLECLLKLSDFMRTSILKNRAAEELFNVCDKTKSGKISLDDAVSCFKKLNCDIAGVFDSFIKNNTVSIMDKDEFMNYVKMLEAKNQLLSLRNEIELCGKDSYVRISDLDLDSEHLSFVPCDDGVIDVKKLIEDVLG